MDDLQDYLNRLAVEQVLESSTFQARQYEPQYTTVKIPVGLTEVNLSEFASYQYRTKPLVVKTSVKFTNGTIAAAPDFDSGNYLLKIDNGVTFFLDSSASVDASASTEANCQAAVGIFGGSTFIQNGDIKAPDNSFGIAIYINDATNNYNYLSGDTKGSIVANVDDKDYDWTVGVGGDFADINVAMTDSRVKDGDVLQVLKGNNAITGQQKITKAVTIQGNGYGSLNDGWLNGTLYVDCAGVTVKGLYVSDGIYLRHNDAVIERCRAGFISATNDYEADDATIRGCFITSFMEGDKTVAPLGWNIHNNIILGQLAYLEDATVNHNAIVYNGDGNIGSDFSMIHGVVESSFTNNIVFIPNKRTSFSSDVLSSLTNFENNIHTNNSNPTNWPTNIYGYETMAKLFACTGKEGTDAYYQTAVGSPAIGYANDGGDCGPWTGSFPYKLNGDDGSHGGGEVPIPEWQVEPNDLLALKNIHQAFGGDSWTTKKWNFDNNGHYREDFPGVTFTDDGRVTAIDLQDNGLVGECFAVSSPQLSELTTLNLSRNRISGDLGKLVSQLGKLTSLDVSYNRLTKTDGVMAFAEAFSSNINVRYQNRVYQTNSPTTAAFTDDMQTMEAQVVTIGKEMKLTVPSLYTYDYKYQEHRMNPPFKVRLMNSPSVNLGQLTYNGSSNYVNGSTYKFGDCGLYNQPQDQRMVLVDEWGSYARYSAFPVILRYVEGDADMTGATNVLDVQYMVNYILAPSTVGDFNYSAANTYADATINVQDIVQTVNIILGVPRTPNYGSRAESGDDDTTWDGYVYALQERIVLTATKDVSAIDIDLEGVSTDEVALMLNRRDFQMIGRNTEWGSRYMIFSPTGKMIPAGTATALLRMSGAGQPVSVECANPQAQAVTVAVGSAPTGIASVRGEAAQEAFYNLSGQRVDNPRKGVYLQRGKKIVVKE